MMSASTQWVKLKALLSIGTAVPLTRIERWTLLALSGVGCLAGVVLAVMTEGPDLPSSLFQLGLTAIFGLICWSTAAATLTLFVAIALSFSLDSESITFLVMGIAIGCVVRVGTSAMVGVHTVAFLAFAAVLFEIPSHELTGANLVSGLMVAAASSAIGLLLRVAVEREQILNKRLEMQAEAEREAAKAERLRIADELHDVIAHDLTVIAMHARVLEADTPEAIRADSQRTIREHARKALDDLRRVVEHVNSTPFFAEGPARSMSETIEETRKVLVDARYTVKIDRPLGTISLPRVIDSALARILHESSTNILKHGEPGLVHIGLETSTPAVVLTVRSPIRRTTSKRDTLSGGYGTIRMSVRTRQLGGDFMSGEQSGDWVVRVYLPTQTSS